MTDQELALSPDLSAHLSELVQRLRVLERAPRYVGQAVAAVPLQTARDFGFTSADTTTYKDMFRADVWATGPILDYDIATSDSWVTSAPTSIDWQLVAHDES